MSEDVLPVLVLGAGRSGVAAARLLLRENERVVVYDREPDALDLEVEALECLCVAVVDGDARAACEQCSGGRAARSGGAQHQDVEAFDVHRSFMSDRLTSPRMIDTIQQRTMICGSGQPLSS